tara:strand:+ start:2368 stop:3699 length:1332 start_codon:yes stop_codon:yes gene_type:complete
MNTRPLKKIITLLFFCFLMDVFLIGSTSTFIYAQDLKTLIDSRSADLEDRVIEWRRHIHQNPELSNREYKTAEYISKHLTDLGLEVQTGVAHTGVVAILEGATPGPVVALRADMDALPVTERTPIPFKSTAIGEYQGNQVGVMHACGHDTHVAILMGVAQILTELKNELNGTVKFIFQPAEEGAPTGEEGGAELMVKEGVLKNPDVDAIFGLHISDATPVGMITYKEGGIMASSNTFQITVNGKQAHGSAPWSGIDPIVTSAQIINNLQTIISRNMELTNEAAVVTVGQIHGGVRSNIIPEEVFMEGTIRALDNDMRDAIFERIKTIAIKTAEANGGTAEVTISHGYPITYNDPELTRKMVPTLQKTAGENMVVIMPAITGAEDFSFFQQEIPGLYFFLGGLPEGGTPAGHHTPDFYIDESGLELGVRSLSHLVIDYFASLGN